MWCKSRILWGALGGLWLCAGAASGAVEFVKLDPAKFRLDQVGGIRSIRADIVLQNRTPFGGDKVPDMDVKIDVGGLSSTPGVATLFGFELQTVFADTEQRWGLDIRDVATEFMDIPETIEVTIPWIVFKKGTTEKIGEGSAVATLTPDMGDDRHEPDDAIAQVCPPAAGNFFQGYVFGADDVDLYTMGNPDGSPFLPGRPLEVTVSNSDDQPLQFEVYDSSGNSVDRKQVLPFETVTVDAGPVLGGWYLLVVRADPSSPPLLPQDKYQAFWALQGEAVPFLCDDERSGPNVACAIGPAAPIKVFQIELSNAKPLPVTIHNQAGELVRTLEGDDDKPAGRSLVGWDGLNEAGNRVASGVYLARFPGSVAIRPGSVAKVGLLKFILDETMQHPPVLYDIGWGGDPTTGDYEAQFRTTARCAVTATLHRLDGSVVRTLRTRNVCFGGAPQRNCIRFAVTREELAGGPLLLRLRAVDGDGRVSPTADEVRAGSLASFFSGVDLERVIPERRTDLVPLKIARLGGADCPLYPLPVVEPPPETFLARAPRGPFVDAAHTDISLRGLALGSAPGRTSIQGTGSGGSRQVGVGVAGEFTVSIPLSLYGRQSVVVTGQDPTTGVESRTIMFFREGIVEPVPGTAVSGLTTPVTVTGHADARNFRDAGIQVGQGALPRRWETLAQLHQPTLGNLAVPLASWNLRRVNGMHTLRLLINGQEINRSVVSVGQTVPGSAFDSASGGVSAQAGLILGVPVGAVAHPEVVTITPLALNEEVVIPALRPPAETALQPLTPPYEILPGSMSLPLSGDGAELRFRVPDAVLEARAPALLELLTAGGFSPAEALAHVRANLGVYGWDGRRLQNLSTADNTRRRPSPDVTLLHAHDLSALLLVLPAQAPPRLTQVFASPFIFSPESTTAARQTTTLRAQVRAPTADAVWVRAAVRENTPARGVVRTLVDGGGQREALTFVRALATPAFRGTITLSWDGRDELGRIVPDGVYHLGLEVADGVGNTSLAEAVVVKGRVPPEIASVGGQGVAGETLAGGAAVTGPPAEPAGLGVTNPNAGGVLTLSWFPNTEADLEDYGMHRSLTPGFTAGPGTLVTRLVAPGTTHQDGGLAVNQVYYYRLTARDLELNESGASAEVSAMPTFEPPAIPQGLTVENPARSFGGDLALSWQANSEADLKDYGVSRALASGALATKTEIARVAAPFRTYEDRGLETGQAYFYQLTARNLADHESAGSSEVSGVPVVDPRRLAMRDLPPPGPPPPGPQGDTYVQTTAWAAGSLARTWGAANRAVPIMTTTTIGRFGGRTFVSAPLVGQAIPAGPWEFHVHGFESAADQNNVWRSRVYLLDSVANVAGFISPNASADLATQEMPLVDGAADWTVEGESFAVVAGQRLAVEIMVDHASSRAGGATLNLDGPLGGAQFDTFVRLPWEPVFQGDDVAPPAAPSDLSVVDPLDDQGGALRVSWAANSEADLLDYGVYRGAASGSLVGKTLVTRVMAPARTVLDTGLENGQAYFYQVTARDTSQNESAGSEERSGVPSAVRIPAVPTGLQVTNPAGSFGGVLRVTWLASSEPDLQDYGLYRGGVSGALASKTLVTRVPAPETVFDDTGLQNGQVYFYQLTARNTALNESAGSVEVSGTPAADPQRFALRELPPPGTPPAGPQGEAVYARTADWAAGSLARSWGATNRAVPIMTTTTIGRYGGRTFISETLGAQTLPAGTWAFHVHGFESLANQNNVWRSRVYLLDSAANVVVYISSNASADLATQEMPLADGAADWTVEGGSFAVASGQRLAVEIMVDHTSSKAGSAALNFDGPLGGSDFDTWVRLPWVPQFQAVDTTPPGVPAGVEASDVPADAGGALRLTWVANTEPDLKDYGVYRGDVSGAVGVKTLRVRVPVPATRVNETGLTNGQRYYYQITARDTSLNESAGSIEVSGVPIVNVSAEPTGTGGQVVSGLVPIHGTAVNPAGFLGYRLAVAPHGSDPRQNAGWVPLPVPAAYRQTTTQDEDLSSVQITDGLLATWDTTQVADGLYDLRLVVLDVSGTTDRSVVASLRVQNGLGIVGFRVTPNPFETQASIRYEVLPAAAAAGARVQVRVEDLAGTILAILQPSTAMGGGVHALTWPGTGAAVTGDYVLRLVVEGLPATLSGPPPIRVRRIVTNTLQAGLVAPTLNQTVAGTIQIRGVATADPADFREYVVEVQATGLSGTQELVRTSRAVTSTGVLGTWDTTTASNGDALVRLRVRDRLGHDQVASVPVRIENPVGVKAVPETLGPGPGTVALHATLPADFASVTAVVEGPAGATGPAVRLRTFTLPPTRGVQTVTWDGTDDAGVVPAGTYRVTLSVMPMGGGPAVTAATQVTVLAAAPDPARTALTVSNTAPLIGQPYYEFTAAGQGLIDTPIAFSVNWELRVTGTEKEIVVDEQTTSSTGLAVDLPGDHSGNIVEFALPSAQTVSVTVRGLGKYLISGPQGDSALLVDKRFDIRNSEGNWASEVSATESVVIGRGGTYTLKVVIEGHDRVDAFVSFHGTKEKTIALDTDRPYAVSPTQQGTAFWHLHNAPNSALVSGPTFLILRPSPIALAPALLPLVPVPFTGVVRGSQVYATYKVLAFVDPDIFQAQSPNFQPSGDVVDGGASPGQTVTVGGFAGVVDQARARANGFSPGNFVGHWVRVRTRLIDRIIQRGEDPTLVLFQQAALTRSDVFPLTTVGETTRGVPPNFDIAPHISRWLLSPPLDPERPVFPFVPERLNPDVEFSLAKDVQYAIQPTFPPSGSLIVGAFDPFNVAAALTPAQDESAPTSSFWVVGDEADNRGQDRVIARLRAPPAGGVLRGRTLVRVEGDAAGPYRLEYGPGEAPIRWTLIKAAPRGRLEPQRPLGYWDVTGLNGTFTVLLTEYADGAFTTPVAAVRQTYRVGQPMSQAGGSVSDPYQRVSVAFPPDALIQEKFITIRELVPAEVPVFNPAFRPVGPIFSFEAGPTPLTAEDFARDPNGTVLRPATLTFRATPRELGLNLDNPVDQDTLARLGVWEYEPKTNALTLVPAVVTPNSSVVISGPDRNDRELTITAQITKFSAFFLARDEGHSRIRVVATPNPVADNGITVRMVASQALTAPPQVTFLAPDHTVLAQLPAAADPVGQLNQFRAAGALAALGLPDGLITVRVTGQDLSGRPASGEARLTVDRTLTHAQLEVQPVLAGPGRVSVSVRTHRVLDHPPGGTVTFSDGSSRSVAFVPVVPGPGERGLVFVARVPIDHTTPNGPAQVEIQANGDRLTGSVVVDTQPPRSMLEFDGPVVPVGARLVARPGTAIRWALADAGSGVSRFVLNGATIVPAATPLLTVPESGALAVRFYAVDAASNVEREQRVEILADAQGPRVRIEVTTPTVLDGTRVMVPADHEFQVGAVDDLAGVAALQILKDGEPVQPGQHEAHPVILTQDGHPVPVARLSTRVLGSASWGQGTAEAVMGDELGLRLAPTADQPFHLGFATWDTAEWGPQPFNAQIQNGRLQMVAGPPGLSGDEQAGFPANVRLTSQRTFMSVPSEVSFVARVVSSDIQLPTPSFNGVLAVGAPESLAQFGYQLFSGGYAPLGVAASEARTLAPPSDFHTYTVRRTLQEIQWLVDGTEIRREPRSTVGDVEVALPKHLEITGFFTNPQEDVFPVLEIDRIDGTTVGLARSGTWVSAPLDAGTDQPDWMLVAWTAQTPTGSTIQMQTRSSPDGLNWDDWSAPLVNPGGSPVATHDARFLQVRATLTSDVPGQTPVLQEVKVVVAPAPAVSEPVDSRFVRPHWTTIHWTAVVPTGTTGRLQTRTSPDAQTWSDWSAPLDHPMGSVIQSPDQRFLQAQVLLTAETPEQLPEVSDLVAIHATPLAFATSGPHTLVVSATDAVGNMTMDAREVLVDVAPPTTTVLLNGATMVTSPVLAARGAGLTFTATDPAGIDRTEVSLAGGPFERADAPVGLTQGGRQEIRFRSVDRVGNVEPTRLVTVEIDTSPPTFSAPASRVIEAESLGNVREGLVSTLFGNGVMLASAPAALSGDLVTLFVAIPEGRVDRVALDWDVSSGTAITLAYRTAPDGAWRAADLVAGDEFAGMFTLGPPPLLTTQVQLRATLHRPTTDTPSPELDALGILTHQGIVVTPEPVTLGSATIQFAASEPLLGLPTITFAPEHGSTQTAVFVSSEGLMHTYRIQVGPEVLSGLAGIMIEGADRVGNLGRDESRVVRVVTDEEPPVTLVVPDTALYPDGIETFARPVTFTLTAIDPGRELVKFDFTDPALQGQSDPRWRVLSGTWKVEEQAYRGLAGINEENPTIRALSVTDHFTDYVLHLTVEDELAGEDTNVGVLIRAQEAVPGKVTGGYAVQLDLSPGRGDGGGPGEISLWKLTGSTSLVRLGGARLPQPPQIGHEGMRRRVPVTVVLQGHRIRVAPQGIVVVDVTDPAGPLDGHLGLQVTAANEGGHAARFDDIRLLDLSDLTVASGVTALETTVASTPETVVTSGETVTVAVQEPGAHTVSFHAVDAAGNAEPSRTVGFIVDTMPPTLALTQTTPEFVAAGAVAMTVTASEPVRFDPAATVNPAADGPGGRAAVAAVPAQPQVSVRYTVTAADAEGVATLRVEARDRAGNLGTLTVPAFEVDRTPPAVALQAPLPATLAVVGSETAPVRLPVVLSEPATATVTMTGPAGGTLRTLAPVFLPSAGAVAAEWDGRDAAGKILAPGSYGWTAEVVDRAGNRVTKTSSEARAPGVVVEVGAAILADVTIATGVPMDVTQAPIGYRVALATSGARAVRLSILRSDGTALRTLLPRVEDAGLRGGGSFTEIWDGRDAANQPLVPGGYWLRAEVEEANPVLRAFAVVPALTTAVTAQDGRPAEGAATLLLPGGSQAAVTREGPRMWRPDAISGLGAVKVGGVRPGGEIRMLQPADDLLTIRLPFGDGIRITPEGGLPMGTVLQVTLATATFSEQVALYRFDGGPQPWGLVPGQVVDSPSAILTASLTQGGLYVVLRAADQAAPTLAEVGAPPAFSPTGDGRFDVLSVTGTVAAGLFRPGRVTLQITAAGGSGDPPLHVTARTRLPGRVTEAWAGLDAQGRAQPDGRYAWSLQAEDVWRSTSPLATGITILDTRTPDTATSLTGVSAIVGPDLFLTPATKIVFTATDPLVNGVASGVTATTFQVDQTARAPYTTPFTLAEGRREVRYGSEDLAGNVEPDRSATYLVDGTAPQTVFMTTGPFVNDLYVSTSTVLQLTATDPLAGTPPVGSGVEHLLYTIDAASTSVPSVARVTLVEGVRLLTWQAEDRVKNLEAIQTKTLRVDGTPPRTTLNPSHPFVLVNGETFARADTTYTLTALDPEIALGMPGSGVAAILYRVDGSSWQVATSTPFTLAEGRRVVEFTASDLVGNTEAMQTITISVDGTPPVTTSTVGTPQDAPRTSPVHAPHPLLLVAAQTPVTLAAADPQAGQPPVSAGVASLSQRITAVGSAPGGFTVTNTAQTTVTLSGRADGDYLIEYQAQDRVANVEALKSLVLTLDGTPPVARLHSPAPENAGVCQVVKGTIPVVATITDQHLATYRLEVAGGANATSGFTALVTAGGVDAAPTTERVLTIWDTRSRSGWQTLRLVAQDLVLNTSTATLNVFVGDPALTQTLGATFTKSEKDDLDDLDHPEGVAIAPDGTRWVADSENDRLLAFTTAGALLRVVTGFHEPQGIAVLQDNTALWVADRENSRLVKLTPTGTILQTVGRTNPKGKPQAGSGTGQFNHPGQVAVDALGRVYVADRNNHRWQRLKADGSPDLVIALPLVPEVDDDEDEDDSAKHPPELEEAEPFGVAVTTDAARVYVSEEESGQVFIYTVTDTTATLTGTLGGGPGTFKKPQGLATTRQNHVYVAERNAHQVRKYDKFGHLVLVFGTQPGPKTEDSDDDEKGKKMASDPLRLFKPTALAVGPNGELAVAVRNDDGVKIFSAPDIPTAGGSGDPPLRTAAPRPAQDLSALGPPHDFAVGPNPARAGAPINVYFVTGWNNFETEVRVYTAAGELVGEDGGVGARPAPTRSGSPAYAPGRYAVAWAPRQGSGQPLASGVYLVQIKVRNPEMGEVVSILKKILVVR